MAFSNSLTNEEVRHRILNVYAKFVSDVEPDRLSDWLMQEHVITIDQKQRICHKNPIASDRCRAILDHLFSIKHPRAFLVVLQALVKENHYLLEEIDNQEPRPGIRVQPVDQSVLYARIQELENDLMRYRSANTRLRTTEEEMKQRLHQLESESSSDKSRVQQLEKDFDDQKRTRRVEQTRRQRKQNELETKLHTAQVTIQKLEKDKEEIMKRVRESENNRLLHTDIPNEIETNLHLENLRNGNNSNPVLVQKVKTKASKKGKEINGLAILGKELFVVNSQSSEVEVYDTIKCNFIRRWNLKKLNNPLDIVSCNRNECLYIFDFKGTANDILRVDPNGNLIKKWTTGGDCGRGLSITDESNIILAVLLRHKLMEYSPDGVVVREILLTSCPGLRYPRHAVKLTNGDFVISHGFTKDDLLRVWVVDSDGKVRKKSFDGECVSSLGQTDYPFHLSVDGNGFVMVADPNNGRVLLLDSELEFKREVLSKETDEIQIPSRILLDELNGRLIVADNNVMNRKTQILFFDYIISE